MYRETSGPADPSFFPSAHMAPMELVSPQRPFNSVLPRVMNLPELGVFRLTSTLTSLRQPSDNLPSILIANSFESSLHLVEDPCI
jgi:hypothetical protein